MKKSYKRLFIFESFIFLILLFNSFLYPILLGYKMLLFLIILLLIFKAIFGLERNRQRYSKIVSKQIITSILFYLILYYLLGIIVGFAKSAGYYNFYGITRIILPMLLIIPIEEYLRYEILIKSEGNKVLPTFTCILFIFWQINSSFSLDIFKGASAFINFAALILLPSISNNILCNYLTKKAGYLPSLIFIIFSVFYDLLIPIIPNPNIYVKSVILFTFPLLILYKTYLYFNNEKDEHIKREYNLNKKTLIIPIIITAILVYFVSGYFKYYAIAVATGSMKNAIQIGDVVIVNQRITIDKIKKGDIIAFNYNNYNIVHRVHNIIETKEGKIILTKGDANEQVDNWTIKEGQIIGKVEYNVKYIGLPTVWLSKFLERKN